MTSLKSKIVLSIVLAGLAVAACRQQSSPVISNFNNPSSMQPTSIKTTGSIQTLDERLKEVIRPDATIEILAEGFTWSEGPLWLPGQNKLLFSDIPPNKIFQWTETGGLELYLTPSGYTGTQPRGGEVGSNALILNPQNQLALCQHGDRRMAYMDAPLDKPQPQYRTLADKYEGKRLNSPNDAVYNRNGDLYFTDPPYGLEKNIDDPAKELPFQGVYRLAKNGQLHLLTKELSRPNGLAFSPDEKILYVANSDPDRAIWMAYDVQPDGNIANGRVFFDATNLAKTEQGLPDGLKVTKAGYLLATGPGGVLVFTNKGEHLGTIKTGQATSNCALNEDESVLYMTAHMYLMRIKLK